MNQVTEQERADFEAWYHRQYIDSEPLIWAENVQAYRDFDHNQLFGAYQAGRAALQSQEREDAERYRAWRKATASNNLDFLLRLSDELPDWDEGPMDESKIDEAIDHARPIEGET